MRTALLAIIYFLEIIMIMLARHFSIKGFDYKEISMFGILVAGIAGAMLFIDWRKNKEKNK